MFWSATFPTTSAENGYNFTARYDPDSHAVILRRDGAILTPNASIVIGGGNIAVSGLVAAGIHSWTISLRSWNTVSSISFGKAKYYRGQTFSIVTNNSMTPISTDLAQYYDPDDNLVGATIGSNFAIGTYTAIYWCENSTDAGWAKATVPVTDNGSISVHVTDSMPRAVPGVSVKIKETGAIQPTNPAGDATFVGIEYSNYTLYIYDDARGINESHPVAVNVPSVQVNHQLTRQWVFPGIPVTIQITDKFNDGFPGVITITNQSRVITTESRIGTATSGGYYSTTLDEGVYAISVTFGSPLLLNQTGFTVTREAITTFTFNATSLDAHPSWHSGTVTTWLHDSIGRQIPGASVIVTSATGIDAGTTDATGHFPVDVYWGNGTGVDVEWFDGATSIGTRHVTLATTGSVDANLTLVYQWRFTIPITIQTRDRFASGFPGIITIRNATSGTIVSSATASAAGFATFPLLETTSGSKQYNITINYPTRIYTATFGVLQGNATWMIDTTIDAYPSLHSTTVDTTIRDSLSRWIDGVNVTLVGTGWIGTGITGNDGKVTFYNVYWGYSTSFTVTWRSPAGTVLNSSVVTISTTTMKVLPTILLSQYIYPGLTITFSTIDKFSSGFPALVRYINGTTITTTASNGIGTAPMNEGTYSIQVVYNAKVVNSTSITIRKTTGQAFTLRATILDSSPGAHVATLVSHLQDSRGHDIYGVTCRVTGADGYMQSMTGSDGNATITGNYWGNSTTFTVSWFNGGPITSTTITMSEAKVYHLSVSLLVPYTFKNLPVAFNFTDKNNVAFPAFVSFFKSGTIPSGSGAAGANGYYQTALDEGNYVVKVEYPSGTFIANRSFTVNLANYTTRYNINFPGFSSQIKICSLVVNVKDSLGRDVYPVMVKVNGTGIGNVAKSTITDGGGNALFTGLAYQDYPSYTIYVYFNTAGTGSPANTTVITVSSDVQNAAIVVASQFYFPDIVTTITVVDAFSVGYRANIAILDATNTTTLLSEITTGSGQRVVDLDEGRYSIVARYNSVVVANRSFTVLKGAGNAFTIATGIDAYPDTHSSPVTITARDSIGRLVDGLHVNMTSNETNYDAASADGIYRFPSIYWAFDQWFNVTIHDGFIVLGEFQIRVNAARSITWNYTTQYIFEDVPIQITILDVNGIGFEANVEIRYQNGSVAWTGQSSSNGIINLALDEGNYTVIVTMLDGAAAGSSGFEVQRSTGVSFTVTSLVDAYPPGPQLPWWAYLIIISVTAVVFVSIYKVRHEKRERKFKDTMSKRKYFEDVESFSMVMCIHDLTGVELGTHAMQIEQKEKAMMAAGLINALGSFGKEIDAKTSQMQSFHYKEWSANLFHGKYCMFALLTDTDIGAIAREKMVSFVEQYERAHDDVLKDFKGNVTTFVDFEDQFNKIFGTELLDPCYWKMKEINEMPRVQPVLMHHLKYLIDKARIKYPSLKDLLVTIRAKDRAPPDTIYDMLYDIYLNGLVIPAKHDTKQSLQRYMIGSVKSASIEEIKMFQDVIRAEVFERGKIIDDLDKKVEGGEMLVTQGRLTEDQKNLLVKKCSELRDAASKELDALGSYTFEKWKDNGNKVVLDQPKQPAKPGGE